MGKLAFLLIVLTAAPLWGQFSYPASASTRLSFAQLADGGPPDQRWTTTIRFINPNTSRAAMVNVSLYRDNGQPLSLDFGQGATASLSAAVPAGGMRSFTSTGTASATKVVVGWASATSDLPVTGIILFEAARNGIPFWDVSAFGAGSTFFYASFANRDLGVALANPNARSIDLRVTGRDGNGVQVGTYDLNIPPFGHSTFNLVGTVPWPTDGFDGSITITPTNDPPAPFVALALNSRDSLVSSLPPGEMSSPPPSDRRPFDIGMQVIQGGVDVSPDLPGQLPGSLSPAAIAAALKSITLAVDADSVIRARYNAVDNKIHLSSAMAETLGSSAGAMAFLIGHMALHSLQTLTGTVVADPGLRETLADEMGLIWAIKAGFDPGGGADFYARMQYAFYQGLDISTSPDLTLEFGIPNGIPTRLQTLWNWLQVSCAAPDSLGQACTTARKKWHPSYPASVP
jgi:hypothetical protein